MEITKEEMVNIINSGNLYFQHPANLHKGICPVKSMKELKEISMASSENGHDYDDVNEIFTYWENHKTPLFDIVVSADKRYININNVHLRYELSECSLIGMYWLYGNKKSVGIENVCSRFDIPIPDGVDLEKYTKANFKLAKAHFDFV